MLGPISDYGNIQTDQTLDPSRAIKPENLQALYDKLQLKHKLCLERNNIAFIVGGSKDLLDSVYKSYQ